MKQHDRRSAPRVDERVILAITDTGLSFQTETRNLSTTGVYCTVDRFVSPMTKLALEWELPAGSRRSKIRCAGVVVRVEPVISNPTRGLYNIAIFFTDISDRDRAAISQFVRERLSHAASS